MNESIVAKTTISVPVSGGTVEAVSTIETVPYWTRSKKNGEFFPPSPSPFFMRLYNRIN